MQLMIRIKQLLNKITNSNSNSPPTALVSKNPAIPSPCILLHIHSRWWLKVVFCIDLRGWFERIMLRIYRHGRNEQNPFFLRTAEAAMVSGETLYFHRLSSRASTGSEFHLPQYPITPHWSLVFTFHKNLTLSSFFTFWKPTSKMAK